MKGIQSGTVIAFPKSKKRGPKVRTGPSAAIIALPVRDVGQSDGVLSLLALMEYADRKYGSIRPPVPANDLINNYRADLATP